MTKSLSYLAAVVLLAACAAPSPGEPTPASTPTAARATAVATASATVLALVAPVAPPPAGAPDPLTVEQRAAFTAARLLVVEGDYNTGAERWRSLLSAPAAAADARYFAALSLALGGQGADALALLNSGVADARDGFVRGLALDAANQHGPAMQALADFAASNPTVAPAVWLEVAERELAARRPREAADATSRALDTAQVRPLKQRLLDVRAQALAALGDNDAAFDAHRQVLALATSKGTLGEQLFHLAQVSRDLSKPDAALQALKTVLGQFPSASTTADALRLLDDLHATDQVDAFVLGRARYFAVDYRNAVTAFDRYLAAVPDGPDAPAARLYKALASLTPSNEPNALRALDALADDPNQDSDIAARALVEAGEALEGLSLPDQAEARYQKLLDKFPRLDAAALAAFRLGLVRYVRGADAEAITAWEGLIARRDDLSPDDVARALYWRGKALGRLGRDAEARSSFEQAEAVRPSSYYSLRAASVLGQLNGRETDPSVAPADEQQLAQWMAARGQDLSAASSVVDRDTVLARAEAEASVGLYREGNWEADELLSRYADRADRLYVLARRFDELGLVSGAARLGQAAYAAASIQSPRDAPLALLKVCFPRPFANLSDAASVRYGVDQLLLDASMRDASLFDAWWENAANGSRGVAAMSPVHADEAAAAVRADLGDVFRPVVAVDQYAWLLADRLRRFDGRPEVALSAIATPDRLVDSWTVRPGAEHDIDAYTELIHYESVRNGLHRLLATRMAYAVAYGRPAASLTSGDPIEPERVKPEPTNAWIKISRLSGDVPPEAPLSSAATVGTPDQQSAFARGAMLQRDGDYASAAAVFADVTSGGDSDVVYEAQLRLGQSLIALRRPADALAPLQSADAARPGSAATFLLGRALADIGHCSEALPAFQRFATANPGPLAAQALVAQANCLAELGRTPEAVPLLEQASTTPDVPRLQTLDFREKLAVMRVRAGDTNGAHAVYQSLLSIARSASYKAELNYYLAVLAGDGDPSTATGFLRAAVQLDPKSRAAQAALDELVTLGDPSALSFEAGETRFAQNRYREALAAYSAFIQQNASDSRTPRAFYGRGVSLVRLGQDRSGITVLESMADLFPNTTDAADGLFRAGRIRESLADLDGAVASYRRLLAMSSAGPRATDAQFRIAFVQFQQGLYSQAAEGWRSLASSVSAADERAQALFWLGKALRAQGDTAGASSAWTAASNADPHGFYALRAAEWLAGQSDPRAAPDRSLAVLQSHAGDDPLASLSDWVSSRGDVASARQRLAADPGLARAEMLLAIGQRKAATWELGAVESRVGDSLGAMALLGAWEQQRGLYNTALLLGYDLAGAAHVSLTSGPPAIRRLVYPLVYPAVLAQASQQLHVDPLLFSGLMLQESLLDQTVESAAQARGLSQIIASTAYDAARALGQYSFRSTDLYQPLTNITLGAFVLGERLARYDNGIFPPLAAYNAGQFAVDGWLLSAGGADIDTFAEAIPYTETYSYVHHIYENYRQYLELYST